MQDLLRHPQRRRRLAGRASAGAAALGVLAAIAAFWPLLRNGFVNWDDPTVLVDNAHLGRADAVGWAFSTTLIGHYQPLAWIAWSAVKSQFGLWPAAFHGISLALHVANGLLVFALALRLTASAWGALGAALLFLLHPISVEAVAWASAFPYVLSLSALLLSFLAYVDRRLMLSLALYALSLLTRATALGYPLILLIADWYPLERTRRTSARRLLIEKLPFAALAVGAAAVEWRARDVAALQDVGLLPRLTLAATAPFVYLGRMLWPVRLTPLNALPISPAVEWLPLLIGVAAVAATTA